MAEVRVGNRAMVASGLFRPRRGDGGIMRLFCPTRQMIFRKISNRVAFGGKPLNLQQPPTVHGVVFGI
ncbi:hypothetical protein [Bradyrhizobium sp. AZCC 2230]|uniref:hypothetical protein n=1 Tax=Bradyrhizobium sp. AZCC 2230 TaxID=3117021 RepID=UPI002FEEDB31